jgi:hypothetical protein
MYTRGHGRENTGTYAWMVRGKVGEGERAIAHACRGVLVEGRHVFDGTAIGSAAARSRSCPVGVLAGL